MKDITDKRRSEAEREQLLQSERAARSEAERSGRMKDEFLATLGHELRTPLNAILGWAQVLRHTDALNGELRKAIDIIERNARAQAQIIEDLLDMSASSRARCGSRCNRVDLASVVEASIKRSDRQRTRKGSTSRCGSTAPRAVSAATRIDCSRCSGTC